MRVKVKLSGGNWHDDNDLIWQGDLQHADMLHPGSTFILKPAGLKAALKVMMIAVEVDDVEEAVYVFYVNPLARADEETIRNFQSKTSQ